MLFAACSNPHRHHHVAVLELGVRNIRAELAGRLRVLELDAHLVGVGVLEEIEQVLRVEANGNHFARIGDLDRIFRFAGFGRRRRDFQLILLQPQANGARALVGKLRDALDSRR